jgi:hypothetical protein
MGRWIVLALALAGTAHAAPCDYTLGYARGEAPHVEWRLLDPRTGADTLMFVLPGAPVAFMWDSLPRVDITVGHEIWRSDWRFAPPVRVARLPDIEVCDVGYGNAPAYGYGNGPAFAGRHPAWWCTAVKDNDTIVVTTLWTSRDGFRWEASKPDTQPSEEPEGCWPYGSDGGVVPLLASGSITIAEPTDEDSPRSERCYEPVSADTTRGFEYSYVYPDVDMSDYARGPVFWVDHRKGVRVPLVANEDGCEITVACGVAMLASMWAGDPSRVIDVATGRVLRVVPADTQWVPRPRP